MKQRFRLSFVRISLRRETSIYRRLLLSVLIYVMLLWRSSIKRKIDKDRITEQYENELTYSPFGIWKKIVLSHKIMARYVLMKLTRAIAFCVLFLRQISTHAVSAPVYAVDFVSKQTLTLQDIIQARVEDWINDQMDSVGEKVKNLIKDPYMPQELISAIDDAVDIVLPDIKLALLMKTDEYIQYSSPVTRFLNNTQQTDDMKGKQELKNRSMSNALEDRQEELVDQIEEEELVDNLLDEVDNENTTIGYEKPTVVLSPTRLSPYTRIKTPIFGVPSMVGLKRLLKRVRARVLYTLFPYDKSIWINLRNPYYVLLTIVGLIPWFGNVWWLFIFIIQNKRDEHGVCQFILGYQTAKFFSQGCLSLIWGAFLFYKCANREVPTCMNNGPRVSDYSDAFGFCIQIILVWFSFFLLPYTVPCHTTAIAAHQLQSPRALHNRNKELKQQVTKTRGDRLTMLFWWDTFTIVFVLILGTIAYVFGQHDWQLRTTFYWLRTIYGLLSLPFVFFKLPLMGGLLTTTKSTGYDMKGHIVLKCNYDDVQREENRQIIVHASRISRRNIHSPAQSKLPLKIDTNV